MGNLQGTNLCCGKFHEIFPFPVYIYFIIMYCVLFADVNLNLITHCKSVMLSSRLFFKNAGLLSLSECMKIPFNTVYLTESE
jgi:ascorbate-specific PTS system EIIC-type component UlaA